MARKKPGSLKHFIVGVRTAAVFGAIITLSACSARKQEQSPVADLVIKNVTIIDAIEGERSGMDVTLVADRIHKISPTNTISPPIDAVTIDGSGKYLIPGLWDAHVHLTFTEGLGHDVFFPLAIAHGVTSLRDTGGHLDKLAPARTAAAADPLSPDLYISGPLVDGPLRVYAGQTPFHPDISVGVASPDGAERMVDDLADAGVDFIKAYEMLPEPTFRALVTRAKERGLPVAAHAPLSMTASDAALLGANDLQHMRNLELSCPGDADDLRSARREMLEENDAPHPAALRSNIHKAQRAAAIASLDPESCDELIEILAETAAIQTPTLMISRFRTHGAYGNAAYRETFDLLPKTIAEGWKAQSLGFAEPSTDPDILAHDVWRQAMLPRLYAAGVPIMAGMPCEIEIGRLHLNWQTGNRNTSTEFTVTGDDFRNGCNQIRVSEQVWNGRKVVDGYRNASLQTTPIQCIVDNTVGLTRHGCQQVLSFQK